MALSSYILYDFKMHLYSTIIIWKEISITCYSISIVYKIWNMSEFSPGWKKKNSGRPLSAVAPGNVWTVQKMEIDDNLCNCNMIHKDLTLDPHLYIQLLMWTAYKIYYFVGSPIF